MNYSIKLIFLSLFSLLILGGCQSEDPVVYEGVELIVRGKNNFGAVLLGESKNGAIELINHGPNELDLTTIENYFDDEISSTPNFPFRIFGGNCIRVLAAKDSCIFNASFTPTAVKVDIEDPFYRATISLGTGAKNTVLLSGRGISGGSLFVEDLDNQTSWDVGTTTAGQESRRVYRISNLGDSLITAPFKSINAQTPIRPGIFKGIDTCPLQIPAGNTCTLEIVSRKTIAGTFSETVVFSSAEGGDQPITITNVVIPGEAFGSITLTGVPSFIPVCDSSNPANNCPIYVVQTSEIRDSFGNILSNGTPISVNANANVRLLGSFPTPSVNGRITFTFQARTTIGRANVSVSRNSSFGSFDIPILAGPPSGAISIRDISNNGVAVADGVSQIRITTNTITDAFGNLVADGTIVRYFLESTDPLTRGELIQTQGSTFAGIVDFFVRAPTKAGPSSVYIRSNPILDGSNNIIGWNAEGVRPLSWVSGDPSGTIPLTASQPTILARYDLQEFNVNGIPIESTIVAGPVVDAGGNLVAPGTVLNISISNGQNLTSQSSVELNALSQFSFVVAGTGTRGNLVVNVSSGQAQGSLNIWLFDRTREWPKNNTNNIFEIFEKLKGPGQLPVPSDTFSEFNPAAYSIINPENNLFYEIKKNNSVGVGNWLQGLNYLMSPCWVSYENFVQIGPCMDGRRNSVQSTKYDALGVSGDDIVPTISNPVHGPMKTRYVFGGKNQDDEDIWNLLFLGSHYPSSLAGWDAVMGTPDLFGVAFLPSNKSYLAVGGTNFRAGQDNDICHRINDETYPIGYSSCDPVNLDCNCNPNHPQYNAHLCNNVITPSQACNQRSACAFDFTENICRTRAVDNNSNPITKDSFATNYITRYIGINQSQVITTNQHPGQGFQATGDLPEAGAMMSFTNNENNIAYGFGGINPQTNRLSSDLVQYSGVTNRWARINPQDDENERGSNGFPSARYQHGITYVKEKNALFLAGGVREISCGEFITKNNCNSKYNCSWNDFEAAECDPVDGCNFDIFHSNIVVGGFCEDVSPSACSAISSQNFPYKNFNATEIANQCEQRESCVYNVNTNLCTRVNNFVREKDIEDADEIWKLELTQTPRWKKICGSQEPFIQGTNNPNPANNSCNLPKGVNSSVYFDLEENLQDVHRAAPLAMSYDKIRQKIYMTLEGSNSMTVLDAQTETVIPANSQEQGLQNSYQIIYNGVAGKTFGYKRGNIGGTNGSVVVLDASADEKIYVYAKVFLGAGARQYAFQISPILQATGFTVNNGTQTDGVNFYVWNNTGSTWQLVGDNNESGNSLAAFQGSEITQEYSGAAARELVNSEGYLEILFTPKGFPSSGGSSQLNINQIIIDGLF